MNKLILGIILVSLAGCAAVDSMNQMAGLGKITVSDSKFDNSKQITMGAAHLTDGSMTSVPVKLGGFYTTSVPELVYLVGHYSSSTSYGSPLFINIEELDVNLNGKKRSFKSAGSTQHDNSGYNTVSRSIHTDSKNHFPIPLSYLKEMLVAEDCRIRITTSKGSVEALFHIDKAFGNVWAKEYLRRFVEKIEGLDK